MVLTLAQMRVDQKIAPVESAEKASTAKSLVVGGGVSSADLSMTRGYLKIFPPQFASINQVPEVFRQEHWRGPSPWCRVEGIEDHPDFENNLKTIENV